MMPHPKSFFLENGLEKPVRPEAVIINSASLREPVWMQSRIRPFLASSAKSLFPKEIAPAPTSDARPENPRRRNAVLNSDSIH
jgi:hypothetical protein